MVDILHRVGIATTPDRLYDSLASVDGLRRWWTTTVTGDASPGGQLAFYFGGPEPGAVMEVVSTTPDTQIVWRCIEGPAEWVDTTVTFDLGATDDETVLRFAHAGWREPVEFMAHCSTKWGLFLLGLKAGFEGGKATPFPDEVKISSWG
jgi:uncharacterized protein YndB with AHSA1/START domain